MVGQACRPATVPAGEVVSTYDWYSTQLDPTPKVQTRSGPFAPDDLKTVAEALDFCQRKGLDPADVRLAHNHVIWQTLETPEEVQARIKYAHDQRQKHLDAIREMYEEYVERGLIP